jgi:hypothetical protein
MKYIQVIMLLCVLFTVQSFAKVKKPYVAVMGIAGDQNVSSEQLEFISGKVSMELLQHGAFVVLERNRIGTILQEQGLQNSGCTSNECQVEMGQLLGVEYMVGGYMVSFGPSWMLRLDYIDVGTGAVWASVDAQQEGELHKIVTPLVQDALQKLVEQMKMTVPGFLAVAKKVEAESMSLGSENGTKSEKQSQAGEAVAPLQKEAAAAAQKQQEKKSAWKTPIASALGALGLTSLYLGKLRNDQLQNNREAYDALGIGEPQSEFDRIWDLAEQNRDRRNLLYITGAGLLAGGVVIYLAF